MITIGFPEHPRDDAAVRELLIEYAESLGFSLAYQGFESELGELPGRYAPPTGALLLARADGVAAGVVGLRRLTPQVGEMKRLCWRTVAPATACSSMRRTRTSSATSTIGMRSLSEAGSSRATREGHPSFS